MSVTYPKSGLQDGVSFQQNGKPGTYPVQAWNDEIGTFQFASTLAEGYLIPFGAAVLKGNADDGVRLPKADDAIKAGETVAAKAATGSLTFNNNPAGGATITVGSVTYTFRVLNAAVAAKGTATFSANPTADDTLTLGDVTYKFVNAVAAANDVKIESELGGTIANLVAAIGAGEGEGTAYGTGTTANPDVEVSNAEPTSLEVSAKVAGTSGNSIALDKSSTAITLSGETLAGGEAAGALGENEIELGGTIAESAANAVTALGSSEVVDAIQSENGVVALTAKAAGTSGNSIALASSSAAVVVSGAYLSGGAAAGEAAAANAQFAGVAVFNYYATTQAGGFRKQALDVNVAVKQKGYVTVLMSSLEGADFQKEVALDLSKPGFFKVAGSGDTAVGKIKKVFPAYGTAEILLKEFI